MTFDYSRHCQSDEQTAQAQAEALRAFGGYLTSCDKLSDNSPDFRGFVKLDGLSVPVVGFMTHDSNGNVAIALNLAKAQVASFVSHKGRIEAQLGTSIRKWAQARTANLAKEG